MYLGARQSVANDQSSQCNLGNLAMQDIYKPPIAKKDGIPIGCLGLGYLWGDFGFQFPFEFSLALLYDLL